ncbi:MAG: hypothetical protein AAB300_01290 [Nitrospirota bacterium]
MNTKKIKIVLFLVVILAGLPSFLSAAHQWAGFHWARQTNPFTLKLGDNVSSTWDSYLITTSSDWSISTVLDTVIVPGKTTASRCRASVGRVEVCNYKYGKNGWLGIAQVWTSSSHITQAIVKVNDSYFTMPYYNTVGWKNLVMCQEVGHALGLDHQDEAQTNPNLGTCMDYTSNPAGPPNNEHPNQHDYDELFNIYKHLDTSTTLAQTVPPPAINLLSFDEPRQWGKKIRQSANKRLALYELDFGGGHKVFTFVTLAN